MIELFLSVKIRSDEEIDMYGAEQYNKEKEMMRDVDCFTIIDYIKSSVEILMNMKMDEQQAYPNEDDELDLDL